MEQHKDAPERQHDGASIQTFAGQFQCEGAMGGGDKSTFHLFSVTKRKGDC